MRAALRESTAAAAFRSAAACRSAAAFRLAAARRPEANRRLPASLFLAAALCLSAISAAAPTAHASTAAQDTAAAGAPSGSAASSQGASPIAALAAAASAAQEAVPADTVAPDRFKPISSSGIRGGESDITLRSDMSTTIVPNPFWTFGNSVSIERRRYRTRNMEDVNKSLMNTAAWLMPNVCLIAVSAGETYTRKKTLGLARYKDIVFDNESAGFTASLLKKLPGTSETRLVASATGRRGLNDFKYDKTASGGVTGRIGMYIGEAAAIGGGLGGAIRRESSDIGALRFGPLQSFSDTITLNASIGSVTETEKKPLTVNYVLAEGVERAVTAPKGNYGEILANPSLAKPEKINQRVGSVALTSFLEPVSYLALNLKFNHEVRSQNYLKETRLSSETKVSNLDATARYSYASKGSLVATLSNRKSIYDFGQGSISSYRETERRVSARLSQEFGKTFSIVLGGGTSLMQRFYAIPEKNPRDADILNYSFDGRIASTPFAGVSAGVDAAVTRRETINIDKSLSRDNQAEWVYSISPNYTIHPKPWATVGQTYQLRFEFDDFTYNEQKNYLTRSTTVRTNATFTVARPIVFGFVHSYLFKDSGSYLLRGNERLYNSSSENFEHSILLSLDYTLRDGTTAWCDTEFRSQQSNRLGIVNLRKAVVGSTYYDSGGLRLGFNRKRSIGKDGELSMNIVYNKRFSPNLDEARREFWDVDAVLRINF